MTFNKKKIVIISAGIVTFVGISFFMFVQHNTKVRKKFSKCNPVFFANAPICSSDKLNDKNDIHLIYAIRNGLKKPFCTDLDFNTRIPDLLRKSILVEVKDNRFFQLKPLTHSEPYLIPEAFDMLNEIGFRFHERLREKKYTNYRFLVTSLLRTEEEQNKLSHRNSNATVHSSHLYGTTVDISYKDFYNTDRDSIQSSYEAFRTLTSVLVEMRKESKFLAIRERKQSCFHITVIICRPLNKAGRNKFESMPHNKIN